MTLDNRSTAVLWYGRFEGRRIGPLTAVELIGLAEWGEIDERWQVRSAGEAEWRPATELPGFPTRKVGASVDPPAVDVFGSASKSPTAEETPPTEPPPPRTDPPPLPVLGIPQPVNGAEVRPSPVAVAARPFSVKFFFFAAIAIGAAALPAVAAFVVWNWYAPATPELPVASQDSRAESSADDFEPSPFRITRRNGRDTEDPPAAISLSSDSELTPPDRGSRIYRELAPPGGRLIGVEIVEGGASERVQSVRPIFRTGDAETIGRESGPWSERTSTLKAKPGYAVGGIVAPGGDPGRGFALIFMKIDGERLNPADSYHEWVVREAGPTTEVESGEGHPAIGIVARLEANDNASAMGLVFEGDAPPHRPAAGRRWTKLDTGEHPVFGLNAETALEGKNRTRIVGGHGGIDPDYAVHMVYTWPLIGFEFGLDNRFDKEVITAVRPIGLFRREKVYGQWHGKPGRRIVQVRGTEVYGVSAVRVYGRDTADGVRVTFSRFDGRRGLSTDHSYESELVGHADERHAVLLSGFGRFVTGLVGTEKEGRNTGIGLQLNVPALNHSIAEPNEPAK